MLKHAQIIRRIWVCLSILWGWCLTSENWPCNPIINAYLANVPILYPVFCCFQEGINWEHQPEIGLGHYFFKHMRTYFDY